MINAIFSPIVKFSRILIFAQEVANLIVLYFKSVECLKRNKNIISVDPSISLHHDYFDKRHLAKVISKDV